MRRWSKWGGIGIPRFTGDVKPKPRRTRRPLPRIETLEHRSLLSADLAVAMTAPPTVLAGDLLTYNLSVSNTGTEPAFGTVLADTLPAGTGFVGAGTSSTSLALDHLPAQGTPGAVTFTASEINPHDSYQAWITVRVSAALDEGSVLTDTAQVSSNSPDPTPDDDSATVATTVHRPAVLLSGTVYIDANADGIRQSDERRNGLSDVYIDLNGNGRPDPGEPTQETDGDGNYQFALATPGTYVVRQDFEKDHGYQLTSPAGGAYTIVAAQGSTFTNLDFGDAPINEVAPVNVVPDRFAPAHDVNTALIDGVYRNVLGRDPDPAGFAYWYQALSAGVSRDVLVNDVWNSAEHRTDEIEFDYSNYLHRAADAAGLNFWVTALEASGNEQAVVLALIATPEYQADHASDNDYVTALYNDILGHLPDTAGLNNWVGQIQKGTSRASVAEAIINSNDSTTRIVDSFFTSYLHRNLDFATGGVIAAGLQQHHFLAQDIAPVVLASDEYLADARDAVT